MEYIFDGKKVIVTGAGKGIGRAISVELAKRNARVIAISRTQADLDSLKNEYPTIEIYCADISEWEKTETLLESIGPVDFLVNNAGVAVSAPVLELTKEQFDSVIDINFKAAFHVAQVVARQMVAHKISGAIVNMSSVGSKTAFHLYSAYCCSKSALDMATRTMALELGQFKIRVNSVNPTLVLTEMGRKVAQNMPDKVKNSTPIGRFPEEEDVVNTVLYLLSDKSSMVNGVCITLDGGQTLTC